LAEVLDEGIETHAFGSQTSELVPHALKQAVENLAQSENIYSRRSFKLLRILTVLLDGETFQSIKRFYPAEPFHVENIAELTGLSLLEAVPISQTTSELSLYGQRRSLMASGAPKLLRVPRQVRDYVNILISAEERREIIKTATDLFFGLRWRQGKIRLRKQLVEAYGFTTVLGPGNEHVVVRHLLIESLQNSDRATTRRVIRLGLGYCHRLLAMARFRDAMISCSAMVHLLRSAGFPEFHVEALTLYARSLRMTGRKEEAIQNYQEALEAGEVFLTDKLKGSIYLGIALAHEELGNDQEAISATDEVFKLSHPDSSDAFQAQAIVANVSLKGTKRRERMLEIQEASRRKEYTTVANNVALELAKDGGDVTESLRWLEIVIRSTKDGYNRTRAIIEKAALLSKNARITELSPSDRMLLGAAYAYSYGQRIGNLLDRCHQVLWRMLIRERLWAAVLRLFRYSSFVWRLRSVEEEETKYLNELDEVDFERLRRESHEPMDIEISYVERRRIAHSVKDVPNQPEG
jgi:tetratricopeptide (TPR) repeat protein